MELCADTLSTAAWNGETAFQVLSRQHFDRRHFDEHGLVTNQNVFRFEVSVHHPGLLVHLLQSREYLPGHLLYIVQMEPDVGIEFEHLVH